MLLLSFSIQECQQEGLYSGIGTSNGFFDPVVADTGIHSLTYVFTDTQMVATDSAQRDIEVLTLPSCES